MGAFFVNFQVRSDSTAKVRDALVPIVRTGAFVSPSKNGWVTVYEKSSDDQDDEVVRRIGSELSKVLNTAIVSFMVHDSDIALYWLFQCGKLVDEFNSAPDYYEKASKAERARTRGNADALLPLCVAGTTREQVDAVLHPAEGNPVFAEEIVSDLAGLLGIDEQRVCLGFSYFDEEGEETLSDAAEFEPVGKEAERKEPREASTPQAGGEGGAAPNPLAFAIGMMGHGWDAHKQLGPMGSFPGMDGDALQKQLERTFDRTAAAMLKRVTTPGTPTVEELKAARDKGPDALAELVAKRLPELVVEIGVGAAAMRSPTFLEALLKQGLDPNVKDARGISAGEAAGVHGENSEVYRVIKRFDAGKS
jgi:hypothetical protein